LIRLALYQPEIPQNTGTLLRLGACLGVGLDIIEPCGFAFSESTLKRAGMDYIERAQYERHLTWKDFLTHSQTQGRRLVLLTPAGLTPYTDFSFTREDTLLIGRESDGVPSTVREAIPYHIRISMLPHQRSLNMAIAGAMVVGEALRQTKDFPYA
jgi:tRNA (cytidine/uridine-2'-O-)-methyltransferase